MTLEIEFPGLEALNIPHVNEAYVMQESSQPLAVEHGPVEQAFGYAFTVAMALGAAGVVYLNLRKPRGQRQPDNHIDQG